MITIIDYGMGNLRSVQKALEFCGAQAIISDKPEDILRAEKIILPGVGAFGQCMANLTKGNFVEPIQKFVSQKKPFLGICLGMQLLFDYSTEFGRNAGLGIVAGSVEKFDETLSVPQIGWNTVANVKNSKLFSGLGKEFMTYFVHSYYVKPTKKDIVIGETDYGINYCSAVEQGNVFGMQFHPEKSGDVGLQILKNFITL
jgi:glutamine amidotransferase